MKTDKKDIRTIIELLTLGLLYLCSSMVDSPVFSYLFLVIWVVYWTYNLYQKVQYRKGTTDYVLFPTQNDEYSKVTSITLGTIILALSTLPFLYEQPLNPYMVIGLAIGLLILLNGIFDLPKGRIQLERSMISISGIENEIDQRELKEIGIYNDHLTLTNINGEVQRVGQLNLDAKAAESIDKYISIHKRNVDLTTVNNVQ